MRARGALTLVLALVVVPASAGAPRFRFERTVEPGAAGPNRLEPDAALLAHAAPIPASETGTLAAGGLQRGLADLRFFDPAGREVPYLLIAPLGREPEWRPGRLLPIASTKTASGFEIDLGDLGGAAVDRLRLAGLRPPFLKRFRLEGGGDRSRWTLLVDQGTLFDLPEEGLTRTAIDFPAGVYRYLRLTWDDASSGRLPSPDGSYAAEARLAHAADSAPPGRFPVEVERRPSEPGKSRFRLRLPGTDLPVVALELTVPGDGPLLRRATVTEGRLGGAEIAPVPLGGGTLRRTLRGGLVAADLRLPIARPQGRDLELTVEDGNNPPLDLAGAQAVLAPLPWIYFEAATVAPLTARFGDRGDPGDRSDRREPGAREVSPPSYDLEALREVAARAHPATARWGALRELSPAESSASSGAAASTPQAGAPIETAEFRFARPIPAGPPGLVSLLLDAAVLAHATSDLGDLRIVGSGHQVPYVLERRDEPLSLDLAPTTKRARKGDPPGISRYEVTLPYKTLPAARLVLATTARVFERTVRLFQPAIPGTLAGPQPSSRGREPAEERELAEVVWRHADPEAPAPPLGLDLPAGAGDRLEITLDEGDNAPLPLAAPRLQLPSYHLRYVQPKDASLRLLYGRPGLSSPRYDLSLFTAQLLGDTAREVALLPEPKPGEVPDATAVPRTVFWAALGVAVLALLVVLARLLRNPGTNEG